MGIGDAERERDGHEPPEAGDEPDQVDERAAGPTEGEVEAPLLDPVDPLKRDDERSEQPHPGTDPVIAPLPAD